MVIIGIDPGVHTGVAIWDLKTNSFLSIASMGILEAMETVIKYKPNAVYIEDARKRKWFGESGRERLQGAGSIKRDCQIWDDFFRCNEILHYWIAPKNNKTKMDAMQFKKLTGYQGKTNVHGRDAGALLFGR